MAPTARQILGALGERFAAEHYARLGFRVLDRNHRTGAGEIDLVVTDARTIVFVEVKTRRAGGLDPALAIGPRKRMRMRALAAAWLADRPRRARAATVRVDAVTVLVDAHDRLVALEQFEDVA